MEQEDFSRAYTKLKGFVQAKQLQDLFKDSAVLDVGSSTGGFTKLSLELHAKKVIAVEVGTRQMRSDLARDKRVKLYEKTDILNVGIKSNLTKDAKLKIEVPDLILMDVSFISCRRVIEHLKFSKIAGKSNQIILLFKPQFEAKNWQLVDGIVKNSKMRRELIHQFEDWLRAQRIQVVQKMDSTMPGSKGNLERLYLLKTC